MNRVLNPTHSSVPGYGRLRSALLSTGTCTYKDTLDNVLKSERQRRGFSFASAQPESSPEKLSMKILVTDRPGALRDVLDYFGKHNVNLSRIESRPSRRTRDYEFLVDFEGTVGEGTLTKLIQDLKKNCKEVTRLSSIRAPWFPRRQGDLNIIANEILDAGSDLQADHPGFKDQEYRKRRQQLADLALHYRSGEKNSSYFVYSRRS
jgi:phenylalanine-4-hydroxylase